MNPLSRKSRHSRESGNPLCSGSPMDPRFRGGDDICDFHSFGWVEDPGPLGKVTHGQR
jgi:hypothetical protein